MPLFMRRSNQIWFRVAVVASGATFMLVEIITGRFGYALEGAFMMFCIFGGFQVFFFPDDPR